MAKSGLNSIKRFPVTVTVGMLLVAVGLGNFGCKKTPGASPAPKASASRPGASASSAPNDAVVVQTSRDALVVRAHEQLLSEARFCSDDSQPEHDCTSAEEQDIEQNRDSKQQWIRGCHVEHYTKYEVFDRAKETWTLRLTLLDDVSPELKDSEKIQVQLDPQRIVVSGPGCNEVFSLPSGH